MAWDLRHANPTPLVLDEDARVSESGPMARPGMYSASLIIEKGGEVLAQTDAIRFEVKPIYNGVLQGVDHDTYESFRANYAAVEASYLKFSQSLDQIEERIEVLKANSARIINYLDDLKTLNDLGIRLADLKKQTSVSPSRDEVGEKDAHTALSNLRMASRGFSTTYGPTPLHHRSLSQAKEMLLVDQNTVEELSSEVTEFVARLEVKGIHVIQ